MGQRGCDQPDMRKIRALLPSPCIDRLKGLRQVSYPYAGEDGLDRLAKQRGRAKCRKGHERQLRWWAGASPPTCRKTFARSRFA